MCFAGAENNMQAVHKLVACKICRDCCINVCVKYRTKFVTFKASIDIHKDVAGPSLRVTRTR